MGQDGAAPRALPGGAKFGPDGAVWHINEAAGTFTLSRNGVPVRRSKTALFRANPAPAGGPAAVFVNEVKGYNSYLDWFGAQLLVLALEALKWTGVSINMPAHDTFDPTGLDEVQEYFDFAVPGTLAYCVPGAWAGSTLPTGTVPNHAQWAMDTLGEGARLLTISGQPAAGVAEYTSKKALNVAFRRTAAAASEAFTIGNQRIRDHVAQFPTHTYAAAASIRVTRPAAASWTPSASQRIIGFVDGTNDRVLLRANPARALLTGTRRRRSASR